jgi:hypothetical protein
MPKLISTIEPASHAARFADSRGDDDDAFEDDALFNALEVGPSTHVTSMTMPNTPTTPSTVLATPPYNISATTVTVGTPGAPTPARGMRVYLQLI